MSTRFDFRRRPSIEELEPRILFSADLAPMLDTPPAAAEQRLLDADGEFAATSDQEARLEIVFVDTRVDNTQQLLDEIRAQADGRTIEVVLLDSDRDGIGQIGEFLAGRQDIDALHIISHGSDGSIQLGATDLDLDTLLENAAQLGVWGDALSADADILLYGCDVAAGTSGRALVDTLAQLTGADVAASTDLTGSVLQGGDWLLEYQDGVIETALALDAAQSDWTGTLAAPALDLDGNDSSGAAGADYVTHYPVAGGPIAVTGIDAKLSDSDSANLGALTVSIVNLQDGANESLAADTAGTSITASYDSGTGVLTLSGTDTVAHYQQVLRTITYENSAATPSPIARTLSFQANDGGETSNLATATVNWNYVRDDFSPSATNGNDGSVNWSTDWALSGAVNISGGSLEFGGLLLASGDAERGVDLSSASNATISFDYWHTGVLSGSVTLEVSSDGGGSWTSLKTYSGALLGTSPVSDTISIANYTSATTQVRFNAAGLSLLGSINFDNVEIRFDSHGAGPALDLDADNSSGATGTGFAGTFTEGGGAVVVADADAILTDVDSATLTELVATITNPLNGAAESLAANIAGTSISASYDSATATLTLSGLDTVAHYQQVLRTITYDNSADDPGASSRIITFAASDGTDPGNTAIATLTVSAVNDPPVNGVPAAQSTDEDTPLVFSVANGNAISVSDPDAGGSPVEVTLTASNGALTLSGTGGLSFVTGDGSADASMTFSGTLADINAALDGMSFTPDANFSGAAGVQIDTSDLGNTGSGGALTDSDSVAITVAPVNDAPAITSDGGAATAAVSVAENTAAVTTVAATDVDVPADTLTYSLVGGADQALFTIDTSTGALAFVAAPNFEAPTDSDGNNVYEVTVAVADGNGGTDTQAISVTVTNVNEAPVAADDSASGNEDTAISGNVLANDSDVDGDTLTAALVAGPANGSLVLNADGSFSYTPDANFNGSDSFTYVASDGTLNSNTATVTLTVNPVNDAPTAADTTINATEDTVHAGTLPAASDPEGDTASYALGGAATHGTATVNPDGSFSYAPNANFNGSDSFTYTVDDGNGGTNTYLVSVNVAAVNDAPTAAGDSAAGLQGTVITGNVLSNDGDPDGDTLTAVLVSGPKHGSIVLNPDGSFSYRPSANFSGSDSFTYRASDGSLNSGTVTVALTVSPTGNVPEEPPPAEPPVEPEAPDVDPPPPVFPLPGPPVSQPPVAPQAVGELAETPVQPDLGGGYESRAPRLEDLSGNRLEEFTHPSELDAWLTQLIDTARLENDPGNLHYLVSPAVSIELTEDSNFKVALYAEEAKISAIFLSAGAVWWALRSGGLLASLLASLPAWRSLDVLPVLRDDRRDGDPLGGMDEADDDTRSPPADPAGPPTGGVAG